MLVVSPAYPTLIPQGRSTFLKGFGIDFRDWTRGRVDNLLAILWVGFPQHHLLPGSSTAGG
jgi:hypothetical protein